MGLKSMHEAQKQERPQIEPESNLQLIEEQSRRIEELQQELSQANLQILEQNTTLEKQNDLLKKLNEENKNVDLQKKLNAELRKKNRELEKKLEEEKNSLEYSEKGRERAEKEVGIWKSEADEWKAAEQDGEQKIRELQRQRSVSQYEKNLAENRNKQYSALFKQIRLHLGIGGVILLFGFLVANNGIIDDFRPIMKLFTDAYGMVQEEQGAWKFAQALILVLVFGGGFYGIYRFCVFYQKNFWDSTSKKLTYYLIIVLVAFANSIPINIFFLFVLVEVIYIGVRMYQAVPG